MLTLRKIGTVALGIWFGLWVVQLVLGRLLGVHGAPLRVVALLAAVLCGIAMIDEAKALEPMPAQERHDTVVGCIVLVGGVAALACAVLVWPWGLLAAAVLLVVTAVLVRRVP